MEAPDPRRSAAVRVYTHRRGERADRPNRPLDDRIQLATVCQGTTKRAARVLNSILETAELVRARFISPLELTRECLARIERLNPVLNAFITVTEESALEEARQAEAEIQRGDWRGPLHGIPIALKDLFDTAGVRTTAASGLLRDRVQDLVSRFRSSHHSAAPSFANFGIEGP